MEFTLLPYEIWQHILRFSDKATLKALRLGNRWFTAEAIPFLFDELMVLPYFSSFNGLLQLQNSHIRNAVRHIRYEVGSVSPMRSYSGVLNHGGRTDAQRKEFRRGYPDLETYLTYLESDWVSPSDGGELHHASTLSAEGIIEIDHHRDVNLLTALLGRFPSVAEVSLTNSVPSFEPKDQPASPSQVLPHFFLKWFKRHRSTPQTPLPDDESLHLFHAGHSAITARAQSLIFAVCNHYDRVFSININSANGLTFDVVTRDRNVNQTWRRKCLRNCDSLSLSFHENVDEKLAKREDYGHLSLVLVENSQMRDLKIRFHDVSEEPQYVLAYVATRRAFPPLQHLELGHFIVQGKVLVDVLEALSESLRFVKLTTIYLHGLQGGVEAHNSWIYVIKSIANILFLDEAELDGLLCCDLHVLASSRGDLRSPWNGTTAWGLVPSIWADLRDINVSQLVDTEIGELLSSKGIELEVCGMNNSLSRKVSNFITSRGPFPSELKRFEHNEAGTML